MYLYLFPHQRLKITQCTTKTYWPKCTESILAYKDVFLPQKLWSLNVAVCWNIDSIFSLLITFCLPKLDEAFLTQDSIAVKSYSQGRRNILKSRGAQRKKEATIKTIFREEGAYWLWLEKSGVNVLRFLHNWLCFTLLKRPAFVLYGEGRC